MAFSTNELEMTLVRDRDKGSVEVDVEVEEHPDRYLSGLRLVLAVIGLGIALFLPTAEASIISTSLVTISRDLGDYDQSSWVVTAYLVTYTGFIFIWSKLGNTIGNRNAIFISGIFFMAFSAGCGSSSSVLKLTIFRAFQGLGGAGMYSVPNVVIFQLVPSSKYNMMNTISACLMALAFLLGPLIGGAISQTSNWRWIFYFNLPASAVSLLLVFVAIPNRFPNHCRPPTKSNKTRLEEVVALFNKADVVGAALLLGATCLLVTALQEGGVHFEWKSAAIILFFIISAALWILFGVWEWFASHESSKVEPMFPRRFFNNHIFISVLLAIFLAGVPLIVAVIQLPQRFQIVNGATPIEAGVRLLAYAVPMPFGIILSNTLSGRLMIPLIYTWAAGAALETIGFALLSTLPSTPGTWSGQYGYSFITGLGVGISVGLYVLVVPVAVEKRDQHLSVGAALQIRMLGSAMGLAIVTSAINHKLRQHLADLIPLSEVERVVQTADAIGKYPPLLQNSIREVYGEGFNLQMRVTIAFCAAKFLLIVSIWQWPPLRLKKDATLG